MIARHLPWWVVSLLGGACVVLGAVLIAKPFRSLSVLAVVVAATLILTGVSELASGAGFTRPWLSLVVGLVWLVVGVVALSWPGITIHALAIAVGVALVAGGVAKIISAVRSDGEERFLHAVTGLTNVVVGGLALTWPVVTVLVLAVIFGVRTALFGVAQVALGLRLRGAPAGSTPAEARVSVASRWPGWLRLTGAVIALVLALGGVAISVAVQRARPGEPGPFYTAPSPLPDGPPGTIIRNQVIEGFHAGSTAYKVLYKSTGYDGSPTAVSGFIVVPDGPAPAQGRNVVAYTHGTVGVATGCAPSLLSDRSSQPLFFEGGAELLAAGYVVAAPDYQGLGTRGPHPYLVGASEAMNALDSVRAARNLTAAHASSGFVVWGHSQGGQASLFTGQLASSYAPELHLVGVAAGAPVPNLIELFKANVKTQVGKILIAMALQSWSKVYDASLDTIVTPPARSVVAKIARNCLFKPLQILPSVPGALALDLTFLSTPPWEVEPWKTIVGVNDPGGAHTGAPILIIQGDIDPIVPPDVTARLAAMLCSNGETVELHTYPGIAHIDAGHVAAPDVVQWIVDRFAGHPGPTTCA